MILVVCFPGRMTLFRTLYVFVVGPERYGYYLRPYPFDSDCVFVWVLYSRVRAPCCTVLYCACFFLLVCFGRIFDAVFVL